MGFFKDKRHEIRKRFNNRNNLKKIQKLYVEKVTNDTIFAIGDSHSIIFGLNKEHSDYIELGYNKKTLIWCYYNNAPDYFVYQLGPCLAYNTNNKKSQWNSLGKVLFLIKNKLLKPNGGGDLELNKPKIICAFGEIDIRVHIKKQADKENKPIEEIVDAVLKNYTEFILYLKESGFTPLIYGPVPSQSDKAKLDPNFPRYGNEQERNHITKIYNDKLKLWCNNNSIEFKTLFYELIDENMNTKKEFFTKDNVHLDKENAQMAQALFK